MTLLVEAALDRPGVRAVLQHMAQQGIDLRARHIGGASPLDIPEAQLAWLAAHSPWRSGAVPVVGFADLWDGPEPAPGLPDAPERAVVAVANPSDVRRVRAAWRDARRGGGEPLVVTVDGHAPDAADAVADLVVVDARSAAAEAWVVVADEVSPLGAAAVELGRPLLRRGPGLVARLAAALATCETPPQAVGVAALAVGRARRSAARPGAPAAGGSTVVGHDHPASAEGLLTDAVREAMQEIPVDGPLLWVESARHPRFARPVPGWSAVMWHWPFATTPREWVHAAQVACDEIWVGSRAARAHLARAGVPAARVHVIPPGVDATVFTPGARSGGDDEVRLVFTGDLTVRDGADLLLAAAARAFGPSDRVGIVLAPVRTEPALVERAEALSLRDTGPAVRWERAETARELAEVLRGCDAAVHACRGEALTARGLAAMACGLPLIAPDRPGVSEYLPENAGMVVPTRRRLCTLAAEDADGPHAVMAHETPVDALAAAMRAMAGDAALRARMGAVAAAAPGGRDGRDAMRRAVTERAAAATARGLRRTGHPAP